SSSSFSCGPAQWTLDWLTWHCVKGGLRHQNRTLQQAGRLDREILRAVRRSPHQTTSLLRRFAGASTGHDFCIAHWIYVHPSLLACPDEWGSLAPSPRYFDMVDSDQPTGQQTRANCFRLSPFRRTNSSACRSLRLTPCDDWLTVQAD